MVRSLKGHAGFVSKAVFSPDATRVLTVSTTFRASNSYFDREQGDASVRLWHVDSATEVSRLQFPELNFAYMSADGRVVVTHALEDTLPCRTRVWDTSTSEPMECLAGHEIGEELALAVSPDGRFIVAHGATGVKLWDRHDGELRSALSGVIDRCVDAVFSPDGNYVAIGMYNSHLDIWNVCDGIKQCRLAAEVSGCEIFGFSADSRRILVSPELSRIFVCDARSGDTLTQLKQFSPGHSSAFSPDGASVVKECANEEGAEICSAFTGQSLYRLIPTAGCSVFAEGLAFGDAPSGLDSTSVAFPADDIVLTGRRAVQVWKREPADDPDSADRF